MLSPMVIVLSVFALVVMGFFVNRQYSRQKQGSFLKKTQNRLGDVRSERSPGKTARRDLRNIELALDRLGQPSNH